MKTRLLMFLLLILLYAAHAFAMSDQQENFEGDGTEGGAATTSIGTGTNYWNARIEADKNGVYPAGGATEQNRIYIASCPTTCSLYTQWDHTNSDANEGYYFAIGIRFGTDFTTDDIVERIIILRDSLGQNAGMVQIGDLGIRPRMRKSDDTYVVGSYWNNWETNKWYIFVGRLAPNDWDLRIYEKNTLAGAWEIAGSGVASWTDGGSFTWDSTALHILRVGFQVDASQTYGTFDCSHIKISETSLLGAPAESTYTTSTFPISACSLVTASGWTDADGNGGTSDLYAALLADDADYAKFISSGTAKNVYVDVSDCTTGGRIYAVRIKALAEKYTSGSDTGRQIRMGLYDDGWGSWSANYEDGYVSNGFRLPDTYNTYTWEYWRDPGTASLEWTWNAVDSLEILLRGKEGNTGGYVYEDNGFKHGGDVDYLYLEVLHGPENDAGLVLGPISTIDASDPDDKIKVWCKLNRDGYFRVTAYDAVEGWGAASSSVHCTSTSDFTGVVDVTSPVNGGTSGKSIELKIETSLDDTNWTVEYGSGGRISETLPQATVLPNPGTWSGSWRIALTADMGQPGHSPVYYQIDQKSPDIVIFNGDLTGEAWGETAQYRSLMYEKYGLLCPELEEYIWHKYSVITNYDDHDFGWGNASALSGDSDERTQAIDRFKELRAHPGYDDASHVYVDIATAGAEIFLMDCRHRDPNGTRGGSMLGGGMIGSAVQDSGTVETDVARGADEIYESGQNFLTTVKIGDVVKIIGHDDNAKRTFTFVESVDGNEWITVEHSDDSAGVDMIQVDDSYEIYTYATQRSPGGGTVTSLATNKAVDSNATFTGDGVYVGDLVINDGHDTLSNWSHFALIESIDDANTLTLSSDIFDDTGDAYRIYRSGASTDGTGHTQRDWLITEVNNRTADFGILLPSVAMNKHCDLDTTAQNDRLGDYDPLDAEVGYLADNLSTSHLYSFTGDRHIAALDNGSNSVIPGVIEMLSAPGSDNALDVWGDSGCEQAKHEGTHTGAADQSVLTDSSQSWDTDELVGWKVINLTDGSSGTVTANAATTITATLAGGTEDDWDNGDEHVVYEPGWSEGSFGDIYVSPYYEYYFGIIDISSTKIEYGVYKSDGAAVAGISGERPIVGPALYYQFKKMLEEG